MADKKTYDPKETALVVVDPVNDFISPGGKVWEETKEVVEGLNVVANIKRLLTFFRERQMRILYAPMCTYPHDYVGWRHLSPGNARALKEQIFQAGSWGAEWHPELAPTPDDIVVAPHKTSSAFVSTDLDLRLRQHSVERVVLAGMIANTCIDTTGRYAVELGYDVTYITDAIGALSWESHKASVEINYPAYSSAVITTDEFLSRVEA